MFGDLLGEGRSSGVSHLRGLSDFLGTLPFSRWGLDMLAFSYLLCTI